MAGTVDGFTAPAANGLNGLTIDSFDVYVNSVGAPALQLEMYNGSFTGSQLSYQTPRLAAMCPETPDLVLINSIHNYGSNTPAQYLAALGAFVDLVTLTWPTAGVAVMSQNPEKSGSLSPQIAPHALRNQAVRSYCAKKQIGYIPVFEAFRNKSDLGVSLIRSDGVHPTDTTDTADPNNGAYLWTTTVYNWLQAKLLAA